MKPIALAFLLFTVSGCSSSLTSVFERSVQSEPLGTAAEAISMTAERRILLARPRRREFADPVVCLESLPDVARAASAQSRADAQARAPTGSTAARISFDDQFSTSLLQTFQRTQLADVSRNLAWQTCLAYANGAINETQYHALLQQIVDRSFNVLGAPASVGTAARPAGAASAAAPGQIVNNVTVVPSGTR